MGQHWWIPKNKLDLQKYTYGVRGFTLKNKVKLYVMDLYVCVKVYKHGPK